MRGILPSPPPFGRSHLLAVAAAVVAALAAWLSQGTLTYTSEAQARIGLLPLSLPALVITVAAGALLRVAHHFI